MSQSSRVRAMSLSSLLDRDYNIFMFVNFVFVVLVIKIERNEVRLT